MPSLMIDGQVIGEIDRASVDALLDIAAPKLRVLVSRDGLSVVVTNEAVRPIFDEPVTRALPSGLIFKPG